MRALKAILCPSFLVVVCFSSIALGQQTTGAISGTVVDQSGAAISGATVEVIGEGTNISRSVISDASGRYAVDLLPVGDYSVKVSNTGFKTYEQKGIHLLVNQDARVDASLQTGAVQQVVVVQSNATQLETASSTMGKVVDTQQIVELPLSGRNYLQLGLLQPGVAPITTNLALGGSGAAADQGYAVNGLRTQANVFLIDGALNTDLFYTASNLKPPPDAIQEFKILTNSYSAEFWGGGSVVNLIVQSGTNKYHGALWEFLRNDLFNTRNYFSTTVPEYKQNQFGGGAGGPLSIPKIYNGKDRTFFYGYMEVLRNRQGITSNALVPTAAQVAGNFTGSSSIPHLPGTTTPYPNNTVPVNPITAKLLGIYPTSPSGTYSSTIPQSDNRWAFGFRIDHKLNDRDSLSGHYLFSLDAEILPFTSFGSTIPGFPGTSRNTPQTVTIGETHIFSPNMLNLLQVSYNRSNLAAPDYIRRDNLASYGFQYATTSQQYEEIPAITVSGVAPLGNSQGPAIRWTNTAEIKDDLSYVHSAHDLHLGADVRNVRFNIIFGSALNGSYSFAGASSGNALADFELGLPVSFTQSVVGPIYQHLWTYEGYGQDNWRILKNLTLNLGLRYTAETAIIGNPGSFYAAFRPGMKSVVEPTAPVDLVYQGDPGVPAGTYPADKNNFAPRIGFALDPTGSGKWSIRSAFGIFFEYIPGIASYGAAYSAPPGFPTITVNAPTNYANPLAGVNNPFATKSITTPVTFTSMAANLHMPYDEQWNLSVQRQMPGDVLLEAAYVGTRGLGLIRTRAINPAVYAPGATTANTNARRIYAPNFAAVSQIENTAGSNYNGLQLSANKRFSHGLTFLASYTYSKALDNGSYYNISSGTNAGSMNQPENPFNLALEYGLSLFDIRNNFVLSGLYQLPFGQNLTGISGFLAKGWETNFIVTVQSGTPFTVFEPVDVSFTAVGADRPNLTCNPNAIKHTVTEWFNTSCIQRLTQAANPGKYGNEGRDALIGPPLRDMDFSVDKAFPIHEATNLQFRAEAFNIFNHPYFTLPDYTAGDANFGHLLNSGNGRVFQFALKLRF
jgi:Carboxypeptidase regulatory-like domain/TonB dependent receptor